MHTIFYSWQSDLVAKYNRNFIEECIKKALKNLNRADDYFIELDFDRDTKGEAGTPDIANTIFRKIAHSNIFICDISIINSESNLRKMPNPNVLLELGYAAAILGWENIICIYNTHYGQVENLPFDLKFRRPIQYHYNQEIQKNKDVLIKQLEDALKISDPQIAEDKKRIQFAFKNETLRAQKIALVKPDFWEFKLLEELFIQRLIQINRKYKNVERGVIFKRQKNLSNREFLNFISIEFHQLSNTTTALTYLYNNDLALAIGVGVPGDAISILEFCDTFFGLVQHLIDWEIEVRSLDTPPIITKAKDLLLGMTKHLIESINTLPGKIKYVYTNPTAESHEIKMVFDSTENMFEYTRLMEYYSKNLHLFMEE